MSQISESRTKLVWILPSVRDFARRAMSQISDSLSFRGSGKKNNWQTSQICIKVLVYPKTNCLMMVSLVFYMESFTQTTNRKQ